MSTASKKRKISEVGQTKYYAVRAGHTPGVYGSWADCQANITGFRGAQYKSFTDAAEAADFVDGKNRPSKPTGDKFYGVAVGLSPGVYEDWNEAQAQIKGVKGPKYKKFTTRAEAEDFVKGGGNYAVKEKDSASTKKDGNSTGKQAGVATFDCGVEEPDRKRARTSTESVSVVKGTEKAVRVYTDGSSRGNGRAGAYAGVGVYFGDNDIRNVSEPLTGALQTNQRAELTAVLRALEIVPRSTDVHIVTDSNYSINCCEVWYKSWQRNGWKTTANAPVLNKDLVISIRELIDERDGEGAKTAFQWIKGHSADPGNEAADRLAVAGAVAGKV